MYSLTGMAVSPGVAAGPALLLRGAPHPSAPQPSEGRIDPEAEIAAFERTCQDFVTRLYHVMQGPAPDKVRDLFGAVAGFITAKTNQDEIKALIEQGMSARAACSQVLLDNLKAFSSSDDAEIKAQARELNALAREFIASLDQTYAGSFSLPDLSAPAVIIAQDLSPARFLCLHTEFVSAVVLEGGMASGHLGVVLRELRIPALFSVIGATSIKDGQRVLVDADNGSLIVEPPPEELSQLLHVQNILPDEELDEPIENVTAACSVGASRELETNQAAAHGLGLLRSEFLFLGSDHEPGEEEMTDVFSSLFAKIPSSAPITARTFDFAGDKKPIFTLNLDDKGPLKGYGANVGTELLKKEMRALLRAAPGREITIVFPLVTRLSEARCLNDLLTSAIDELQEKDIPCAQCSTALMIETPAAVLSAAAFAEFSSRFIIGTSSLAEYASAPRPPDEAFTPALAKMIALACSGAHSAGVKVGVAGRFAARVELLPFFLKLGVDYITVDSYSVGRIRAGLERLDTVKHAPQYCADLYRQIMDLATGRDITALINNLNFGG